MKTIGIDYLREGCVENETIIGNVRKNSIKELRNLIIEKFHCHNPRNFYGNCCYREKI